VPFSRSVLKQRIRSLSHISSASRAHFYQHFKANLLRDEPAGLTFKNWSLCPHCIYPFCIYLRINSDLCLLQHEIYYHFLIILNNAHYMPFKALKSRIKILIDRSYMFRSYLRPSSRSFICALLSYWNEIIWFTFVIETIRLWPYVHSFLSVFLSGAPYWR
jgi:hypothetical protein